MKVYELTSGATLNIPESLSEMSVEQLIEFNKLGVLGDTVEDIEKIINLFSTGKANATDIPFSQFIDIVTAIGQLLGEKPTLKPITSFELDGVKYIGKCVEELSTKEFIDFETLAGNSIENLPLLLAIIFTPGDEKVYADENYTEVIKKRAELFRRLDAKTAQEALVFFSMDFIRYAQNMVESLEKEMPMTPEIQILMNQLKTLTGGDGNL